MFQIFSRKLNVKVFVGAASETGGLSIPLRLLA